MKPLTKLLIIARNYFKYRRYGWMKGSYLDSCDKDQATKCCALGALILAKHNNPKLDVPYGALKEPLYLASERGVANFNDNPHTTKQDIIALYDKAIELSKK